AEKCVIAAVFDCETKPVSAVLDENGLELAGDQLIIRREIFATGKGRVFVNNQPATVAVLKQLAPNFAVVHAQNESILAFDAPARLTRLDPAAAIDPSSASEKFAEWNRIRQRIADLERDEQDRLRLVDLWSFQLKEIESANLHSGEDQKLE